MRFTHALVLSGCLACGPESTGMVHEGTQGESVGEGDAESGTSGQENEEECGNGIIEGDEQCDDGNKEDGDGCNNDCRKSGELLWEQYIDGEDADVGIASVSAFADMSGVVISGCLSVSESGRPLLSKYSADGVRRWAWDPGNGLGGCSEISFPSEDGGVWLAYGRNPMKLLRFEEGEVKSTYDIDTDSNENERLVEGKELYGTVMLSGHDGNPGMTIHTLGSGGVLLNRSWRRAKLRYFLN